MVHLGQGGGRFKELKYSYNGTEWVITLDSNKAIDIWEWLTCEGGCLKWLYCSVIADNDITQAHVL